MPRNFFGKIAIPSKITTYLSRTLIIITVTTTLLISGVLIIQQTLLFNKLSSLKSQEYIDNQKLYIKEIVTNEMEYIRIQNEDFKQKINNNIRKNVNQAINTAESIYQRYQGKATENEIKTLIIATISSLRFDLEYEEVFIASLDATGVFYPRKPQFTGKDMRQFKDANGATVVEEELNLLKRENEGFLNYELKPDLNSEDLPHKKISFVKKFGHFNWYFGSKQYLSDYFPEFRNEIAQKISTVRFRNGGYVFMNHTNGTPIVLDGKVYKGELNFLENADSLRKNVFTLELNSAKNNPPHGYFYYKWNKMDDSIPSDKCAYVQLFKEYNWLIGAGFYLDEIKQSISDQQKTIRQDQKKSILIILSILVLLLFIEGYIIYHFNKRYKSDFERFFNFFFLSQNSYNKLNISELYFDEFKYAGEAANRMLELRKETEQRLIEEQKRATESDRLKSAFLANMSHEIRTPMNAIIGFSELLEDENQDEPDKILFIKLIRKNGDILMNLINDIIDISKIEANLLSVRKRPVHLNKFLDEVGTHYQETIAARNDKTIQFVIESNLEPDLTILTDEIRLRQILDNLIGNAIKFTSSGTITLYAKKEGETIFCSVSDTGIGISGDQQATIFERFIQAEQDHRMNFGGTGLGLAISKNLVELLGGTIGVESDLGKGSTFYFRISIH